MKIKIPRICLIVQVSQPIELMMISNHVSLCCSFSFCFQSFPAPRSFSISQLFTSGGQSIRASAAIFPMNIQDWFPLELTGLIFCSQRTLDSLLQYHSLKPSILQGSAFFTVQLSHLCMTTGKTIALTVCTFVGIIKPLLFNMLPRFVIVSFQGEIVF